MRFRIHRNTERHQPGGITFGTRTLPIRQRFVFAGPVVIHTIRKAN